MATAAVTCKDLCKTFSQGGERIIGLERVTLVVEEGEFLCLSGPSGSGKTTLLNTIGGLDTPDSGSITVAGQCIDRFTREQLANLRLHNIGFVFQAYNLIPVLSARENVEFVMPVAGPGARRTAGAFHGHTRGSGAGGSGRPPPRPAIRWPAATRGGGPRYCQ